MLPCAATVSVLRPVPTDSTQSHMQVVSRQFAPFELFPVSQRVTYKFYVGRLAVFDENFVSGPGKWIGVGNRWRPLPQPEPLARTYHLHVHLAGR